MSRFDTVLYRVASISLALPGLAACHVHLRDHVEVDGVRLPARHEQVLTLTSWPEGGLVIEAHRGDLRVEPSEGPTTLTVLLHEREPGEAHAHLEAGKLVARAEGGAPCAIGRVVLRTPGPARGLELSTGMGDVDVRGVRIEGRLRVSTGMGDVSVRSAGEPESVSLSSGMGDIRAEDLRCARLEAETGMGDVCVHDLEAREAELSSGMGDVDIERSKGGHLRAGTGLGDVDLVESSFTARELDTGLGRVREH